MDEVIRIWTGMHNLTGWWMWVQVGRWAGKWVQKAGQDKEKPKEQAGKLLLNMCWSGFSTITETGENLGVESKVKILY